MRTLMTLMLSIFACIAMLCSCGTTKQIQKTEYSHICDTIVVHDTVTVTVHVADAAKVDTTASILRSKNDSLLNAIQSYDAKLKYLADQLQRGKLNIDPITKETAYAKATADVHDNMLRLWLEQKSIDANVDVVNTNTTVTDKESNTNVKVETIIKTVPFYKSTWFWLCICTWLLIAVIVLLKRLLNRLPGKT